jgi:hypothetical protein
LLLGSKSNFLEVTLVKVWHAGSGVLKIENLTAGVFSFGHPIGTFELHPSPPTAPESGKFNHPLASKPDSDHYQQPASC